MRSLPIRSTLLVFLAGTGLSGDAGAQSATAEARALDLIRRADPYASVPASLFEDLGWDLPDGGRSVERLARSAPGGAFDPRELERLSVGELGYRASWHVLRYPHYGLDWDITGLLLEPRAPEAGLPTLVIIHGGSANWYEFFVDPLNGPGLGQYLAQKARVLLVTIPGNYRPGGWTDPIASRKPAYLLDRDLGDEETRLRNAIFTFTLIAEGVGRLIEQVTSGAVLIMGHSTGGEIQFLLKDKLASRLNGRSLGWGTGGPAVLRREWEKQGRRGPRALPPRLGELRSRGPKDYAGGYLGPLNPVPGRTALEVAEAWFARESRRRPQFKQAIQDMEHWGQIEHAPAMAAQIRAEVEASRAPVRAEEVVADLFSTMRSPLGGYRKMIWTTGARDDGHWDHDASQARELFVASEFRRRNPGIPIRVLVYDLPMTHYGHIEKPRQLAGATLAAARWLAGP